MAPMMATSTRAAAARRIGGAPVVGSSTPLVAGREIVVAADSGGGNSSDGCGAGSKRGRTGLGRSLAGSGVVTSDRQGPAGRSGGGHERGLIGSRIVGPEQRANPLLRRQWHRRPDRRFCSTRSRSGGDNIPPGAAEAAGRALPRAPISISRSGPPVSPSLNARSGPSPAGMRAARTHSRSSGNGRPPRTRCIRTSDTSSLGIVGRLIGHRI